MNWVIHECIYKAYPSVKSISGDKIMDIDGNVVEIEQSVIDAIIPEVSRDLAFLVLRKQRNQFLSQTDNWVLPDRTPTQAQLDYRQALRDLPANSPNAALDENGELTGVNWPTPPST